MVLVLIDNESFWDSNHLAMIIDINLKAKLDVRALIYNTNRLKIYK